MTDELNPSVREEHFEDVPTDVEAELDESADQLIRPWDPDSIRVNTRPFSLRNILDMIDEKDLELAPDFQRNQVWKSRQKSRLIESVLLQIPLPAFYFAEDAEGKMRVVDGLQRLSTIHEFTRGGTASGFPLSELEYIHSEHGKRFDELLPAWRRRLNNTQIVAHIIDPTTPAEVTYDIFKRINTGGTPLNAQEIRHCMSKDRSRQFLKRCTATEEFRKATGGRFHDHIRMSDRETVLRFLAFRVHDLESYRNHIGIDSFLMNATREIDDPDLTPQAELERLHGDFRTAMSSAYEIFGEHAFRKWTLTSNYRNPINKSLFETWAVALVDHEPVDLRRRRRHIQRAARELMTSDVRYVDAISTSTGDPAKVRYRFTKTAEAAAAS